jgi:hypothetical protein
MKLFGYKAGLILGFSLAVGTFVGCEKESSPATPSTPAVPVPQAGTSAADAVRQATDAAKTTAGNASATVSAEAQKLLDQAQEYIKDKKWDLADTTIKKLEDMKASLPAEWATKVDQARKMLDTAKNAAAAIPGMAPNPAAPAPARGQ